MVVSETPNVVIPDRMGYSVAEVILYECGARNPGPTTMVQVMDVDSSVVNWINTDAVTHVLPSPDGLVK